MSRHQHSQDDRVPPQPAIVALLRLCALDCRTAARGTLEACRSLDPNADALDVATMLARGLPRMMVRRPVLWRPGTAGLSFDEAWIVSLARALARADRDSARFLLQRRVHAPARSILMALLIGLNARLDTDGAQDAAESIPVRPDPVGRNPDLEGDHHGRNRIGPVTGRQRRNR